MSRTENIRYLRNEKAFFCSRDSYLQNISFAFCTPPLESAYDVRDVQRRPIQAPIDELHGSRVNQIGTVVFIGRVTLARSHDPATQCEQVRAVQTGVEATASEVAIVERRLGSGQAQLIWSVFGHLETWRFLFPDRRPTSILFPLALVLLSDCLYHQLIQVLGFFENLYVCSCLPYYALRF